MSAPNAQTSLAGFDWPGLDWPRIDPPRNERPPTDQALDRYHRDIVEQTREITRLLDLLAAASQS